MTKMVVTQAADFSADLSIKKGRQSPPNSLCKHETISEVVAVINRGRSCLPDELVNEPIEVLLEYTFSLDSVILENSIQAGFGGVRLIPTVEDLNEIITNSGNVVAIQIHLRLVSFGIVGNFGVVFLPVLVVRNGVVHFTFDLTHESVRCEQR